jgi:CBS domain-containing protein
VTDDATGLVGILSRCDLEPFRGHYEWTLVAGAMTRNPMSVDSTTPIDSVANILRDRRFNSLPVLKDGILVGTIDREDLIRFLIDAIS